MAPADGVVRLLGHTPGEVDLQVRKGIAREPTVWSFELPESPFIGDAASDTYPRLL